MEISRLSLNEILREINVGKSRSLKTAGFGNFEDNEFCRFGKFQPSKSAKIHKTSEFTTSQYAKKADFALDSR